MAGQAPEPQWTIPVDHEFEALTVQRVIDQGRYRPPQRAVQDTKRLISDLKPQCGSLLLLGKVGILQTGE